MIDLPLIHGMTGSVSGARCVAPQVSVSGTPCSGCWFQVSKGQRKPKNVRLATHRCERCPSVLCSDHIRWHRAG